MEVEEEGRVSEEVGEVPVVEMVEEEAEVEVKEVLVVEEEEVLAAPIGMAAPLPITKALVQQ